MMEQYKTIDFGIATKFFIARFLDKPSSFPKHKKNRILIELHKDQWFVSWHQVSGRSRPLGIRCGKS